MVGAGILMAIAAASCDTPMVATSTTTRGDFRSRRMIARSTTAPKASPTRSATTSPTQNGTWYCTTRSERRAAPTTPMLPTAKLMIRVAR